MTVTPQMKGYIVVTPKMAKISTTCRTSGFMSGRACTECGALGAVNVTPNWHDRIGHATPFTREWRT